MPTHAESQPRTAGSEQIPATIEVKLPAGWRSIQLRPKPLTIGRAPTNRFVIKDSALSREHCVIEPADGGRWRVRDLGSRNGTFVNGRDIRQHVLEHGDVIRIGAVEIAYREMGAPLERSEPGTSGSASGHGPGHGSGHAPGYESAPASATAGERGMTSDDEPALPGAPVGRDRRVSIDVPRDDDDALPMSPPRGANPADDAPSRSRRRPPSRESKRWDDDAPLPLVPQDRLEDLDPESLANDPTVDPLAGFDPLDAAYVPAPGAGRSRGGDRRSKQRGGLTPGAGTDRHPFEERLRLMIAPTPDLEDVSEDGIELIDARDQVLQLNRTPKTSAEYERLAGLRALRLMLYACLRTRATDIHLEDRESIAQLRLRVDGFMIPPMDVDEAIAQRVFGLVKVLCQLDHSRRSTVEDGHFSARVAGRRIDYRVSFTPAMRGRKLVIRVLDVQASPNRLHQLDLAPWMLDKLQRAIGRDAGLVLACGPTGSGKTTTLYSCLREIELDRRNVITIEDPVEYAVDGVTQIPIDAEQGHSFATILRSVLRQDPDVILVGEIRDIETANVVMQASMTGHLVFSTVHAKDTIGSIFRLLDLGVERYLVANALNFLVAQRLVRVLCPHCRRAVRPTPHQTLKMGQAVAGVKTIYVPGGCRRCLATGFRGRRGVFELLEVVDEMRDQILGSPSIQKLRRIAENQLFSTLEQSGWHLVTEGITAYDEVERVSSSD